MKEPDPEWMKIIREQAKEAARAREAEHEQRFNRSLNLADQLFLQQLRIGY